MNDGASRSFSMMIITRASAMPSEAGIVFGGVRMSVCVSVCLSVHA